MFNFVSQGIAGEWQAGAGCWSFYLSLASLSPVAHPNFRKHQDKVFHSTTKLLLTMPDINWGSLTNYIVMFIRKLPTLSGGLLGVFWALWHTLRKRIRAKTG